MNTTSSFSYSGPLESSKSVVNRALILQAMHPNLVLQYQSQAKDILELKQALATFKNFKDGDSKILDAGSGGTTFRFLALYLSKFIGTWSLKISPQLAVRPKSELINILSQLGSVVLNQSELENNLVNKKAPPNLYFQMKTQFWTTDEATVDFSQSSQFFSGLVLAASDHKKPFKIKCKNRNQSSGYENITLKMVQKIGVDVFDEGSTVTLHKKNAIDAKVEINIGADWSSVIYLLSFCFSGSKVEITNVDFNSYEPDLKGLELLKRLGLNYEVQVESEFSVIKSKPSQLHESSELNDLTKNPDLFPIFMVLLSQQALAYNKQVHLKFPRQLIYKESDRLNSMIDVLHTIGFETKVEDQILVLHPLPLAFKMKNTDVIQLDSKADHRLIMSFELLKSFNYNINYNHADEVKKSFANFFKIIKGSQL